MSAYLRGGGSDDSSYRMGEDLLATIESRDVSRQFIGVRPGPVDTPPDDRDDLYCRDQ